MIVTLLIAGIGLASISTATYFLSRRSRQRQLLGPAIELQEVGHGRVAKIIGKVGIEEQTVVAPFSGRECVYYIAIITSLEARTDVIIEGDLNEAKYPDSPRSRQVIDHVPFFVIGKGRRARIDPTDATVELTQDEIDINQPDVKQRLNKMAGFWLGATAGYSFREAILERGADVAVHGHCTVEIDIEGTPTTSGYRDAEAPTMLSFRNTTQHELTIGNSPDYLAHNK